MKMHVLFLALAITILTIQVEAQLPVASPKSAGFDPALLEVLHAVTQRFVDEGQHAGVITLLARDGKRADFQSSVVGRAVRLVRRGDDVLSNRSQGTDRGHRLRPTFPLQ